MFGSDDSLKLSQSLHKCALEVSFCENITEMLKALYMDFGMTKSSQSHNWPISVSNTNVSIY